MASGIDSPSGLDNTSSLEIALDQAIARRFGGVHDRGGKKRRSTPVQNFAVVEPRAAEQAHTPTEDLGKRASTALARTATESSLMRPPRLSWRGIEVSDEFQEYAARVARGEELAPYRGAVLSRPCAEFPWGLRPREQQMLPPAPPSRPSGRPSLAPQRPSLVPQRSSLAPMAVSLFDAPVAEPAVYPERGRALRTALWLAGAVSSIIGALGVGAGATNTAGNEFDDRVPDPKLAQKPVPAAARDEALASSLDDVLDAGIAARQLDSLAASNPKLAADGKPAAAPFRGKVTQRMFPALIPRRTATAPAASVNPSSAPSSGPRPYIPAPGPLPSGELGRGVVTSARPTEGGDGAAANGADSLFSERPSF